MEQPILDPPIPYVGPILGGRFAPGKLIRIQGTVPGVAYRFDINLQCGPNTLPRDDIALQVSVRILDGFIAINSLQNGIWGEELQGSTQPVRRAERFEIIIMCDFSKYKIAVNGQHFCEIPQKIHYDCITHLTIEGDVSIIQITYESGNQTGPSSSVAPRATPVMLWQTNDDFEIINSNKPLNIDYTKPPSYSEIAHGPPFSSNIPPYPINNAAGMPVPTPYPGINSYPSTSPPGIPSPPPDTSVPLNAASSNFRPVEKSNMKKCCGYFWSIIIGIIVVVAVVVSKTNRSSNKYNNNYGSSSYNTYDNNNNYGNEYYRQN